MKKIAWTVLAGLMMGVVAPLRGEEAPVLHYAGEPLLKEAVTAFVHPPPGAITGQSFRVGFYNIEMFTDGINDGDKRNEQIARVHAADAALIIAEVKADILILSEVENARALALLNEALANPYPAGYVVTFGTGSNRDEKMNAAMLSRLLPESVHEIDFGPLTGPGRPTRGIFRAIFDLGDGHYLAAYGAHLKSNWGKKERNYAQRSAAMQIVREDIEKLKADYPQRAWEVAILADFNSDPRKPNFADDPTWKVLDGWIDLWSEHPDVDNIHSVPTRLGDPKLVFPPALFDRVLAHPALRAAPWIVSVPGVIAKGTDTGNIHQKPGEGGHVSDHYPVYVDFSRQ